MLDNNIVYINLYESLRLVIHKHQSHTLSHYSYNNEEVLKFLNLLF